MNELTAEFSLNQLTNTVDILNEIKNEISLGGNSRINLEVGVFKLSDKTQEKNLFKEIEKLKNKVNKLEEKIKNVKIDTKVEESIERKEKTTENQTEIKVEKTPDKKADKKEVKKNKATDESKTLNLHQVKKYWPKILGRIKSEDISMHAIIVESKPVKVEGNKIYLGFPNDKNFHRKRAVEKEEFIAKFFSRQFSKNCTVKVISDEQNVKSNQKDNNNSNNYNKNEEYSSNNKSDSGIDQVAKMFDGQIIETDPDIISDK